MADQDNLDHKVFVGNLAYQTTDEGLADYFRKACNV